MMFATVCRLGAANSRPPFVDRFPAPISVVVYFARFTSVIVKWPRVIHSTLLFARTRPSCASISSFSYAKFAVSIMASIDIE